MNPSAEGVSQKPSHRCHPQLCGLAVCEVHVSGVASPEVGSIAGKRGHVVHNDEVEGAALMGLRSEHGGEFKTVPRASSLPSGIVALDLFAGTGWGVALQARGIREGGVEIMPEAVASRTAAGMETIYNDVWDGLLGDEPVRFWHALQIASPPCQSFSLAGKGAGRAALDDVLRAIDDGAYRRPERLRSLGADTDERTALVLTPLAHVYRDRPVWITWEQVPPVLPVWQACAAVLERWGYSVWVGIIRAEQYGVPQTRRRAVLIARADGVTAAPPAPTHSRYYERDPKRLDTGVEKWVSMADALGFGGFDLVGNQVPRGRERGDYHSRPSTAPAQTLTGVGARPWVLRSNYSSGSGGGEIPEGNKLPRTERSLDEPATTLTSKAGSMRWVRRGLESRPAPTITGGGTETGGAEPIAKLDRYVSSPDWVGDKARLRPEEAAVLQSYPADFPFQGTNGRVFLQIGNAVPPLMGGAILDEFMSPAALRSTPEVVERAA